MACSKVMDCDWLHGSRTSAEAIGATSHTLLRVRDAPILWCVVAGADVRSGCVRCIICR